MLLQGIQSLQPLRMRDCKPLLLPTPAGTLLGALSTCQQCDLHLLRPQAGSISRAHRGLFKALA